MTQASALLSGFFAGALIAQPSRYKVGAPIVWQMPGFVAASARAFPNHHADQQEIDCVSGPAPPATNGMSAGHEINCATMPCAMISQVSLLVVGMSPTV